MKAWKVVSGRHLEILPSSQNSVSVSRRVFTWLVRHCSQSPEDGGEGQATTSQGRHGRTGWSGTESWRLLRQSYYENITYCSDCECVRLSRRETVAYVRPQTRIGVARNLCRGYRGMGEGLTLTTEAPRSKKTHAKAVSKSRCRRLQEEKGMGRGCPSPQPTRVSGGAGRAPVENEFWCSPLIELEKTHLPAINLSFLTFVRHIFSHIHDYKTAQLKRLCNFFHFLWGLRPPGPPIWLRLCKRVSLTPNAWDLTSWQLCTVP